MIHVTSRDRLLPTICYNASMEGSRETPLSATLDITLAHIEGLKAEAAFDAALFSHGEKIEEGVNGIIVRTELSALDPELREEFGNVEYDDTSAAKILKVYLPGSAEKELSHQYAAGKILEDEPIAAPHAKVPRTFAAYDLTVHDQTKEHLHALGMQVPEDHVEIMLMEYITGRDLETLLLQEVLLRHPDAHVNPSTVPLLNYLSLYSQVAGLLHLESTSEQYAKQQSDREILRAQSRNMERIISFLKNSDFVLNAEILQQVETTLQRLHGRGMYHRDAHARNIMVVGSIEKGGKNVQTYLIDFSNAVLGIKKGDNPYTEEDEHDRILYPDDFSILRRLSTLTETHIETRSKESSARLRDLQQLEERIMKKSGDEKQFLDRFTTDTNPGQAVRNAMRARIGGSTSDVDTKIFFIGVATLLRSGKLDQQELAAVLENEMTTLPQAKQNQVVQFLSDIRTTQASE